MQAGNLKCKVCGKACKTKGGLTRHVNKQHPEIANQPKPLSKGSDIILQMPAISQLLIQSFTELSDDDCLPDKIRKEFKDNVNLQPLDIFVKDIRDQYKKFAKRRDAEKFYGSYLAAIPLKASLYFPGLSCHGATMVVMKFAELLLVYHKETNTKTIEDPRVIELLKDKETDSLQYLGGYVLRNIFRKVKKSSKVSSSESQQMIAILETSRVRVEANQKLVNTLNRGGLWAAHGLMQDIFVCCEIEFRKLITVQNIRKIDSKQLVETLVCDITVNSKFNHLLEKTPIKIDNHVAKDTLQKVIELFVNVKAFSHAKGIVESYKAKQHKTKSKSLRKDIKRSTECSDERNM